MNGTSGMHRRAVKRFLDIVFCVLALPVVLPLLVIIALIVRIHFGSSVLFTQERLGFQGRPFFIRKFRTMTDARADDGQLLPDAERLTAIGRFLRATSLDELPELMNVLTGEMSLVGPRPLYSHYRDRYTISQFRRHEVLPGITGWAQVNDLRGSTSIADRTIYDIYYIENWSLSFDVKILLLTMGRVFLHTHAY